MQGKYEEDSAYRESGPDRDRDRARARVQPRRACRQPALLHANKSITVPGKLNASSEDQGLRAGSPALRSRSRQRTDQHTASRRALAGIGPSHHAHSLVTPGHPLS